MRVAGSEEFERVIDGREGLILFFNVAGHTYGIRLTHVVHIDEVERPGAGVTMPDEKVIKYINMRRFFGAEGNESDNERSVAIIFDSEEGGFGLVADAVEEIVPAQEASELMWPPHLEAKGTKIFSGFFRRREKLVPAVNASAVREAAAAEGL